jgi:hypothetical protein
MVASALSMGSGAYLAAKSQREIYEAEFAREREAVEDNEAEARELLALSYQVRGLPEADAVQFVEHLAKDKNQLIRALARERLNTSEEGLSKPLVSAVSGALSTAVEAFIPIIPFFFMNSGSRCGGDCFVVSALRCWRCEISDRHSVMVGEWIRDDLDRRVKRNRYLYHRYGSRANRRRTIAYWSNPSCRPWMMS